MTDGGERPDFTGMVDLASARFGGRALWANDEFFAPAERLLLTEEPVFREGEYTDRGKWMDGWETRRRREPGHDRCLLRLGLPGIVHGVGVSTRHFRGNHPEACSLEARAVDAAAAGDGPTPRELAASEEGWREIVPRRPLEGDSEHFFPVEAGEPVTHLRFHIYPDGGVARLRVYGEVRPDWEAILARDGPVELAGLHRGGRVLSASDGTFADPRNLILPGPAEHMGEGWETRRRRGPGHDWTVLALGRRGRISEVVVDTRHFKGNHPESCSLEACDAPEAGPREPAGAGPGELTGAAPGEPPGADAGWWELLPRTRLGPDARHRFREELDASGPVTHVRFNIYPDGGVSRLRLRGRPVAD